jgi:hypothetical protein
MPSTEWKETVADGEEARFTRYAEQLRAMQKRYVEDGKAGRALHAKGTGGYEAKLEVLRDLPPAARHGLFARPATYEAYVRFSNGASKRQSDRAGDVRGLAVKVRGVEGPKVLGDSRTQDLLGIQSPTTPFRTADEFVAVVLAAQTPATLVFRLIASIGVGRTVRILKRLSALRRAPPTATLAGTRFWSALPIRVGPYAARYAFEPLQAKDAHAPEDRTRSYLTDDLAARLRQGTLAWDVQLQFFENEGHTPIEDASVDWDSPHVTVARLTLPMQDAASDEGKKIAEMIEALSFDPWHSLVEHAPLGGMMRARKLAYYASTQERGAAKEP